MASARVRRRDLVRQPHRLHLGNGAPRLHRLLVGDPQALPTLDPRRHLRPRPRQLQHPSPPCPRPQPGALGRGDRLLLDQSVTRSCPRGFDGAKKIDGIKRHIVVATLACWWPCWSPRPACRIGRRCPGCSAEPATAAPGLGHLWAEQGYTGSVVQAVSRILRFTIQIVDGIKLKGGFITQPRRWVVERTFAWMHRCRRLTASTSRPHWPMKPWSSSASSRSCSAA